MFLSQVDQDEEISLDQRFLETQPAALPSIRFLVFLVLGHLDRFTLFHVNTKSHIEEGWARMMAAVHPSLLARPRRFCSKSHQSFGASGSRMQVPNGLHSGWEGMTDQIWSDRATHTTTKYRH